MEFIYLLHIKLHSLKTLHNILFIILISSSLSVAQSQFTTKSGQDILLYTDYTWEIINKAHKSEINPFQAPKEAEENEEYEKLIKLENFLKHEEILSFIKTKKSNNENVEFENNYESVYNDLSSTQKILSSNNYNRTAINQLYFKYFPEKETTISEYKTPSVTGKTILTDKGCIEHRQKMEETGELHLQTYKTKLLSNTPERLLNYYKNRDYLNINSSIIKVNKEYYLTFDLIFNSKDIEKSYGSIQPDGFIRLTFINSSNIFLKVTEPIKARIQPYTGKTIYTAICKIQEKEDIKMLSKKYIDSLGVMWSSGFENYPIYNIQYFTEKFACLHESE